MCCMIICSILFSYNTYAQKVENEKEIEDVLQYTNSASVYILYALQNKGTTSLKEKFLVNGFSYLLTSTSVIGMKSFIHAPRPNGMDNEAFPSGHAAMAFAGAEFFRMEYGAQSKWATIVPYTIAATTAYLRVEHEHHQVQDVLAGAAIGYLSVKLSYALLPFMYRITKDKKNATTLKQFDSLLGFGHNGLHIQFSF